MSRCDAEATLKTRSPAYCQENMVGVKFLLDLPGHWREKEWKVTVKYAARSTICYIGNVSSGSRARTLKCRGGRNIG